MQIFGQGTVGSELEGFPRNINLMDRDAQMDERTWDDLTTEGEGEEPVSLNNEIDLGRGILNTKLNTTYTILLVGETGKGKTSFLSLLANVLNGNNPNQYVFFHDESNEAGGAKAQSQTNSAKLYELTSRNGITVRILDTPGLADTRGVARDEQSKESIAKAIEESIPIVNAVIILANGTEERLGIATDYALTTLSSIFPRTLAENIGIVFTNVAGLLSCNFDPDSLPDALRGIPNNHFLLDNPLALRKKLIHFRGQRTTNKRVLAELESAVKDGHTRALRELVLLFDWLDTLEPQPTKEIIDLLNKSQEIEGKIESALDNASTLAEIKNELTKIRESNAGNVITMRLYEDLQRATRQAWEQVDADTLNMICRHPQCHANCIIGVEGRDVGFHLGHVLLIALSLPFLLVGSVAHGAYLGGRTMVSFFRGNTTQAPQPRKVCKCGHPDESHSLRRSLWKQRDTNWVIDEEAEQEYNEAKRKNDENYKIMVDRKRIISRLKQRMKRKLASVGRLVESYASLSLAGSFSGQVEKTVKYMEVMLEGMRNNAESDPELVAMVEESLESMKMKLKVVEEAHERAERRVVRVGGNKGEPLENNVSS